MLKRGKILTLCVALSALFGGTRQALADITITPITAGLTVKSPYLYFSINKLGTLGNGTDFPGIQHDPTNTGTFVNGKDYLQPGDSFEGFYINATNSTSSYLAGNNNDNGVTTFTTPAPQIDSITAHDTNVSWTGTDSTIGIEVKNTYTISDTSQYIKITTTLTATQNLTGIQFLRILDPDQDASATPSTWTTRNTLGFTTSSGQIIAPKDAAVAAGSVRPDLKVIIYSNSGITHAAGISKNFFYTNNPADYLQSTQLNEAPTNGNPFDNSIGMAFDVGNLNDGESVDLVYYYLFSTSDVVLNTLINQIIYGYTAPFPVKSYMLEHGGNRNAQAVGGALEMLASGALINNIVAAGEENYVQLATALSGEIHAALAAEVPQSSIWLQNTVSDVLYKSSISDSCKQPGRGVWFAAGRSWDKWNGDGRASGFSADRDQLAFGYDLVSSKQYKAGLGGFYASTELNGTNGSDGSAEKKMAFAYGQINAGNLLIDGIAAAGSTRWSTKRSVTLNGYTDLLNTGKSGFSGLAGLTVSVPMTVKSLCFQPYVSGLLIHEERGSVTEGDAATALTLPGYSMNGTRVSLGASLASACRNPLQSPTTFKLNLEGGIDNSALANPDVNARLGGAPYTIVTPSVSKGYFQTRVEGTVRLAGNGYCYADYTGTFRNGGQSHGVELGIKVTL